MTAIEEAAKKTFRFNLSFFIKKLIKKYSNKNLKYKNDFISIVLSEVKLLIL